MDGAPICGDKPRGVDVTWMLHWSRKRLTLKVQDNSSDSTLSHLSLFWNWTHNRFWKVLHVDFASTKQLHQAVFYVSWDFIVATVARCCNHDVLVYRDSSWWLDSMDAILCDVIWCDMVFKRISCGTSNISWDSWWFLVRFHCHVNIHSGSGDSCAVSGSQWWCKQLLYNYITVMFCWIILYAAGCCMCWWKDTI